MQSMEGRLSCDASTSIRKRNIAAPVAPPAAPPPSPPMPAGRRSARSEITPRFRASSTSSAPLSSCSRTATLPLETAVAADVAAADVAADVAALVLAAAIAALVLATADLVLAANASAEPAVAGVSAKFISTSSAAAGSAEGGLVSVTCRL